MNKWLLLIPVITMLCGWLIHRLAVYFLFYPVESRSLLGMRFRGLLPRKQQQMAKGIAQFAAAQFPLSAILEEKITDPASFQKLMPVIEEKIDHFLRIKLKTAMPVVGMFVGDKTIQQLKTVFVTELETIFPAVMKSYAANLQEEFNVETFIAVKLSAIPTAVLVKQTTSALTKELQAFQWLGALSGLVLGIISLLIFLLAHDLN